MKKIIILVILISLLIIVFLILNSYIHREKPTVWKTATNFEECADAHYPVLESYPRQCKTSDGKTFIEDIGNELEKQNLIRVNQPRPNNLIISPLEINGEARGYWYFEASFPVKLLDGNGVEIGRGIAQAKSDWMVEDFVPFELTIEFQTSSTKKGTLILQKDNPSGLPENDDELIIPVYF